MNDKATVRLIGESQLFSGHFESIAAGIEDRERSAGSTLLPITFRYQFDDRRNLARIDSLHIMTEMIPGYEIVC
jgi:hypothetical protein